MRPLHIFFIGQLASDQVVFLEIGEFEQAGVVEERLGRAGVDLPPEDAGPGVEKIGDLFEKEKPGVRWRVGVFKGVGENDRAAFEGGDYVSLCLFLVRQADPASGAES